MAQIAVVNEGDSLWSIARQYGVSAEALLAANQLSPETSLVLGQAIVIPAANRAIIYGHNDEAYRVQIEVNAYLRPTEANATELVQRYAPYVTYFSISSYRATADGNLTQLNDAAVLSAIEASSAVPMLVVTNFDGEKFSPAITKALFTNSAVRDRFLENLLTILKEKNYAAVNFDFEENDPADREAYNQFLRTVTPKIKEQGFLVSTTLAPKTAANQPAAWFGGLDHDYQAHGEIVDFVIIMTYDIGGWFSGAPAPVSPLPKMREILNYATSVIPSDKILLGLPLYGYDWQLPFNADTDFAETIGPREALNRARQKGAKIEYDVSAQAPFFRYYEGGNEHIVWFEDARSMRAKLELINDYSLRGASYFILGRSFPENWTLLTEMFTVAKK